MLEINFTCLIFILSFIPFVYFLNKALWKPIARIKSQRDFDISSSLSLAKANEERTHAISKKVHEEISAIKKAEQEAFNNVLKEFSQKKQAEENQVKTNFLATTKKTREELNKEREFLMANLDNQSTDLANSLIQRLLSPQKISTRKEALQS